MKDVYDTLLDFVDVFNELELHYAVMGELAFSAYSISSLNLGRRSYRWHGREDLSRFLEAVEARGYSVPEAYSRGWVD